MDSPGSHGADGAPAGPGADRLDVDRLPAPRGKDDLGIAPGDLPRVHDPLARAARGTQLGADITPARDLDDLRHPADSRDQGIGPLLEVHARSIRPDAGKLAHLPKLVVDVEHHLARAPL